MEMIKKLVDDAIENRVFPCCALAVLRGSKLLFRYTAGLQQPQSDSEQLTENNLFDVASLTKPLATALLTIHLLEQEKIALTTPLSHLLPQYKKTHSQISFIQLLTHTAGLPAVPDLYRHFADPQIIDDKKTGAILLKIAPDRPVGQQVVYSCTGYMLLALALKKLTGQSLGKLFRRLIAEPLNIEKEALFAPATKIRRKCIPTEYCHWRGHRLRGEVHDENSRCLGGAGGNAGLFATLSALVAISEIYINGGMLADKQFINQQNYIRMRSILITDRLEQRTLTLYNQLPEYGMLGHTGFTGTSFSLLPSDAVRLICLTNRVYHGRENTAKPMRTFRARLYRALISGLKSR